MMMMMMMLLDEIDGRVVGVRHCRFFLCADSGDWDARAEGIAIIRYHLWVLFAGGDEVIFLSIYLSI